MKFLLTLVKVLSSPHPGAASNYLDAPRALSAPDVSLSLRRFPALPTLLCCRILLSSRRPDFAKETCPSGDEHLHLHSDHPSCPPPITHTHAHTAPKAWARAVAK